MKQSIPDWYNQAEEEIRKGNGHLVAERLQKLQREGVAPEHIVIVASLATRVGMYQFATNILFRQINDPVQQASENLLAEYATCLAAVGNYVESEKVFASLSEQIMQKYALQYADVLFKNWNYLKAKQILEKYCPPAMSSYRELVYGLNLSAAYVECEEFESAQLLLNQIREQSKKHNFSMLYANSLELLGQIYFAKNSFQQALSLFEESEQILKTTNNLSWVFSLKWAVFSKLAMTSDKNRDLKLIEKVRGEARKFLSWETLRSCDLYQAVLFKDETLFNRVYFATPHQFFRKKALKLSEEKFNLNPIVRMGPKNSIQKFSLDLSTLQFSSNTAQPKWTNLTANLLVSLTKDLYRPLTIYHIYNELFPDEIFDPFSSKQKTYKVITKFRELIEGHPSKLAVFSRINYGYRLRTENTLELKYPYEFSQQKYSKNENILERVKARMGEQEFNRKQFCEIVAIPDRSGSRLLKTLEEEGSVEKIGSGRATRYKIAG